MIRVSAVAALLLAVAFSMEPARAQTTPASASPEPAPTATPDLALEPLKAILDSRTAASPGSGLIVAVEGPSGVAITLSGTSGTSRPIDADSLFEIGSVTKTFTATILATMVLDGSVKLDDPIAKYLPKTVHVPQFHGKQITLLNLATQHSGLPRLPGNLKGLYSSDPYADYTRADMYAFLSRYKLTREPGAAFEYSNYGIGLLGQVLAERAHTSYADLLRKRVLEPLGMTATALSLPHVATAASPHATVGRNVDNDVVPPWTFDAIAPAGGLRSSINDMLKYLRCNMGRGPLARACLFAQRPRAAMPGNRIGLVWWTGLTHHIVHHGGDTAGFHAAVAISSDRSEGAIVLANGGLPVEDISIHTLIPSSPIASVPVSKQLADAVLDEYTGTYVNAQSGLDIAVGSQDHELTVRLTGQSAAKVYATEKDEFEFRMVDARLKFVRDDAGKPAALVLAQNGQTITFLRPGAVSPPQAALAMWPPEVALDPTVLASYVGEYASQTGTFFVTLEGQQLLVRLADQRPLPVYASAKDAFYYKLVTATIDFGRDAKGNVTTLTLHQSGQSVVANRK
jgi:CubicO group peptidase (beta-lactamase class C family)